MPTGAMKKAAMRSIDERECFLCCGHIKEKEGCSDLELNILVHLKPCGDVVNSLRRDFTQSPRGRWRPRTAVFRDLWARRPPTASR